LIPLSSLLLGAVLFQTFRFFPHVSALAAVVAIIFLSLRRKYVMVALLGVGMLYPALLNKPHVAPSFVESPVRLEGYFRSPAVKHRQGFRQEFNPTAGPAKGSLAVYSKRRFDVGSRYSLALKLSTSRKRLNPGSHPGGRIYGVLAGAPASGGPDSAPLAAVSRLRDRLHGFMASSFPPETAAFISAVTTGNRAGMDKGLRDAFNRAGLAHVLSISGTHFGFFSILVFGVLRIAISRLPLGMLRWLTSYATPSQAAAVLSFPLVLSYLGISGASIPSIRAFFMISLFLLGVLVGRKGAWLNFLLLAAVVLVVWDPGVLTSLSFQLSFIAVLFIGCGLDTTRGQRQDLTEPPFGGRLRRYVLRPFIVTLLALLGVTPLVAYHFHYFSLMSPFANFIVTPIVCFLLVPLSLAGSFLYLLTGEFLFEPIVGPLAGIVISLVKSLASLPFASVRVASFPAALLVTFYIGFLLFWKFRKRYFVALAIVPALLYAAVSAMDARALSVTFLDCGRSDATVMELPDKKVIVVDTGYGGSVLRYYLDSRGVDTIDALVLTHRHPDHTGGLPLLIERFDVREIWDNGRLLYPDGLLPAGLEPRALKRGDTVEGSGYSISVLHPYAGFYTVKNNTRVEENNDSLVLGLRGKSASFLLAADMEAEAARDVRHLGGHIRSDVIKLPHHGLRSALDKGFLDAVSPRYAVVAGDRINGDVARALGNARILLTGSDGAVRFKERGGSLTVSRYSDYEILETRSLAQEAKNIQRLFQSW
jgi:competence protein ComEC